MFYLSSFLYYSLCYFYIQSILYFLYVTLVFNFQFSLFDISLLIEYLKIFYDKRKEIFINSNLYFICKKFSFNDFFLLIYFSHGCYILCIGVCNFPFFLKSVFLSDFRNHGCSVSTTSTLNCKIDWSTHTQRLADWLGTFKTPNGKWVLVYHSKSSGTYHLNVEDKISIRCCNASLNILDKGSELWGTGSRHYYSSITKLLKVLQ